MNPNTLPQLRILVVDDEYVVRIALKMLLLFDRHLVEDAGSASQALEIFKPGRFDVVITDYDMPDMGGDQLAAAIRVLAPAQPVVMLTANVEALQQDPELLKNLDGIVGKPCRIETLREAIAHAIAGKRLPPSSPSP